LNGWLIVGKSEVFMDANDQHQGRTAVSDKFVCTYVIYIESSADKVWHALTDAELTGEWWGHSNVSDWQVGSAWEHRRGNALGHVDGTGLVLEVHPPQRLAMTFPTNTPSKVTFEILPYKDIVRLTLLHEELTDEATLNVVARVWPAILNNLKTLMETGRALPQSPVEMLP
jgi:uncharacterized protein YndB with AHSA1/START domain